jgi:hypothetical protein
MKEEVRPNKNYSGDICYSCENLIEEGKTQEEVDKDHEECHGWYHCGPQCCGECDVCGF